MQADLYLLMRGELAVGTAFAQEDGALRISFDQCTFLAQGDEAKIDEGQLRLAFTVQATNFNIDETEEN